MKTKIFNSRHTGIGDRMQDEINKWLEEEQPDIVTMSSSSNGNGEGYLTVVFLYSPSEKTA